MRQERILLRLVEAMNLVDEDDRAAIRIARDLRALDCIANILDSAEHGGDRDELGVESLRDEQRQRGLADSRRAPQDHRVQSAGFERDAQGLAGAEQLLLA